jgi:hypothetical protein
MKCQECEHWKEEPHREHGWCRNPDYLKTIINPFPWAALVASGVSRKAEDEECQFYKEKREC